MTDRRLTPANGRVAAKALKGLVEAEVFVDGRPARVLSEVADLRNAPDGARDRQLLFGTPVTVFETGEWCFVQSALDGYVGYLDRRCVGPPRAATHRVSAPATLMFTRPDIKSPEVMRLSLGARVQVTGVSGAFARTPEGWLPSAHIAPADKTERDAASVAERLLGTPYLWGGNSRDGIDCSGLVQAAFLACGIDCPGDSDLQENALGEHLGESEPLRRNDLLFWKGHVALVCNPDTLIHANAHHMAATYESIEAAIARIAAQGGGAVTSRKRLTEFKDKNQ